MKINEALFLKSALSAEHYPKDRRPEIAFVGRSNVGKSTLLNTLLNRQGLAKTSATPGKTQTVNFFDINKKFYFVDLPGYGYAKVPKHLKEQWNQVMVEYLTNREPLRLVVALVDARHNPSEKDQHMFDILDGAEVPTLIVATKFDKLKQGERKKNINQIRKTLELDPEAAIIPFSSVTREGVKELWEIIEAQLEG
ncbi:MAG: YihA family ribosome biogenesis GTP-binding protein [Candidatus Hydrogenedentes bacterium]|nr:YihA family ribosome biogenesis GTP-binding protein [Candidatus Hydrogenedentota bacterium]